MATTRRGTAKAATKATKATTKATKATKAARSRRRGGTTPATQRICNLVPSRDTERDWQLADALGAGVVAAAAAPPATVDLRQPWWTIGDQEDTGSCVGWAVAEGVMRYHFVTAGRLGQDEHLSPRYVWMSSKETDSFTSRPETFVEGAGTALKTAMDVCRKFGIVTETSLPFHVATKMYTGNENTFFAAAAQRRVLSYFNLRKDPDQWRAWLAGHGPILAGLSVDATWDGAAATHGNLDTFNPSTVRGGHAIAIVGYLPNGRFIVRNSWGTAWGDGGFAYASPAYIAAGFFDESYGVTV
jgi:C1A family cysteine protease